MYLFSEILNTRSRDMAAQVRETIDGLKIQNRWQRNGEKNFRRGQNQQYILKKKEWPAQQHQKAWKATKDN